MFIGKPQSYRDGMSLTMWAFGRGSGETSGIAAPLVPEASGQARDALDRAFAPAVKCPRSAPVTS